MAIVITVTGGVDTVCVMKTVRWTVTEDTSWTLAVIVIMDCGRQLLECGCVGRVEVYDVLDEGGVGLEVDG